MTNEPIYYAKGFYKSDKFMRVKKQTHFLCSLKEKDGRKELTVSLGFLGSPNELVFDLDSISVVGRMLQLGITDTTPTNVAGRQSPTTIHIPSEEIYKILEHFKILKAENYARLG